MDNDNLYKYVPSELYVKAEEFIRMIDEDVEIYKIARNITGAEKCIEADKFVAYWNLCSFNKYPHALITLYEHIEEINNSFDLTSENAFDCLQHKIKLYYLLLKENDLIGE